MNYDSTKYDEKAKHFTDPQPGTPGFGERARRRLTRIKKGREFAERRYEAGLPPRPSNIKREED